jgi:hypothetical protein
VYDESALDGYLLTQNSLMALRQIGEGISLGAQQRAWKIVGPYGSGKSALGVVLSQLLAGPEVCPLAAEKVQSTSKKVAGLFRHSHRLSLPIVGARLSFGLALATAADEAAQKLGRAKSVTAWRKLIDFSEGTYKGRPFSAVAGEIAADFADVVAKEGYQGLAILIDEVGKFVEYAALHPEQSDLIAIQQVAEAACKANDDRLVVIAMLHQHFASYAAGVGRSLGDEWHKVSARFEEVPFDEPIERYAHFASNALGVSESIAKHKRLVSECRAAYENALELNFLQASSGSDKKLFEKAEQLYPLHPLTLGALAKVSKRYGQSERSFHAFIKGNEPKGLRDFANQFEIGAWYRLDNLYDYLSEGNGLRFRDLSAERRWAFAQSAIDRVIHDPASAAVLKCVAVLELAQLAGSVSLTAELIAFALGEKDASASQAALSKLVEQGLLIKRRKPAEYSMAVSDAINIEALYDHAARVSEADLVVSGINAVLTQRLVVANRHYDETGTIRTMGILVGTPEFPPKAPASSSDEPRPDAWLKLFLVSKGGEDEKRATSILKKERDPHSVFGILPVTNEGRAALAEFAIWQGVQKEVNSKRLDPWSSRYVESRIEEAARSVERLVTNSLISAQETPGAAFWHEGELVPEGSKMNASQMASWLFSKIFYQTPRIVNELINKERPASVIVLARQRMFDVILSGDTSRPICGDKEFPPERLIHSTLLRDTGIWIETNGRWTLTQPARGASVDISAIWDHISALLNADEPISLLALMDSLAAPPFGVRAGPAGVWAVIYLLVNRGQCAVFERGTLVLELTAEHLQRMYKNPQAFMLRELSKAESSKALLSDYRVALTSVGCEVGADATYLEVARVLIKWFARLPEYTRQTQRISKDAALVRSLLSRATDPIELLTKTLWECHLTSKSTSDFRDWLSQTLSDLGMAHRRLQDLVTDELSNGFAISGSLGRIRAQLQAECSKEASKLADAKLRAFILRCTDLVLTDEKWLDSVGGVIVQRPLDSWSDDTIGAFQTGLADLCGRYKRWMQHVIHRRQAPPAADRFVGLTLTLAGGEETAVFVATTDSSATLAKDLLAMASKSSSGNSELIAAALAQALLALQSADVKQPLTEVKHG